MPIPRRDLAQTLLSMVCLGALIVAAFWIVRPFIAATIWATTIVVVTWPLLLRIEHRNRVPTLIARKEGEGVYRFDIRLQGEDETVFFDI